MSTPRRQYSAPNRRFAFIGIVFAVLFGTFLVPLKTFSAEPIAFQKEYRYKAGKIDTRLSSRTMALEKVKRLLSQELAEDLMKTAKGKILSFSRESIIPLVSGIVTMDIVSEKWDGKTFTLTGQIITDAEDTLVRIDVVRQDGQAVRELEKATRKAFELYEEAGKIRDDEAQTIQKSKAEVASRSRKSRRYLDIVEKLTGIDWFERGFAYQQAANHREASKALTKSLELIPNYAEAFFRRGVSFSKTGAQQKALKDFSMALELNPDYGAVYLFRGALYYNMGSYQPAIADLTRVIAINPEHAEAYVIRGATYHRIRNYEKAIEDFTKVTQLNPAYSEAYKMLGSVYTGAGKLDQAIVNETRAIDIEPGNPVLYFNRGTTYYRAKDYEKAIEDFTRAIGLNPQYGEAYAVRGATHGSLGDLEKANEDLKKAARLGDKDAENFLNSKGISWQ